MENQTWCVYQNKCVNGEHHSRWHQGLCGFVFKQFLYLIDAKSDKSSALKMLGIFLRVIAFTKGKTIVIDQTDQYLVRYDIDEAPCCAEELRSFSTYGAHHGWYGPPCIT
jgi:hypothetical protein